MFKVGDPVSKTGGDYRFDGFVVAAFNKLSGVPRYVVEDDRGILHIYSEKNLACRQVLSLSIPQAQLAESPPLPGTWIHSVIN